MFRPDIKTLVRKFLILMVLVAGLVVLSSGLPGKGTLAAVCCSACGPQYNACVEGCDPPGACNASCGFQLRVCQRTCTPGC